MKLGLLTGVLFLFIACNNSSETRPTAKTKADSLMDEVIEGHNTAMPKMSKIEKAKSNIQHVIDSLSKLPTEVQKKLLPYRMQLDSTFNRLTFANYGMDKWMNEFNMDSFKNNKDEQVKYLESEKLKITKVNEIMINSLKKADSLLKNKMISR